MKLEVNKTKFGSITIAGEKYEHDVLIRSNGEIEKRKKKLSKEVYGTSHTVSLEEAKYIYEKGAVLLIIGTGQFGMLKLSDEAADYFSKKKCKVRLFPTPGAGRVWNNTKGPAIGMFHITC